MAGRTLIVAAALALAGCQPADEAPPAAVPQAAATPGPAATSGDANAANLIASAASLAGEYRIAGVDGAGIDLLQGITAAITADRIDVTSDCIRLAWSYRFEKGVLATERVPVASCRRALLPEEEAIAAAFDSAGLVRRTAANGIEFAGGDRSVTLFSQ